MPAHLPFLSFNERRRAYTHKTIDLMADFPQTRIVGKVGGQFLHATGGCRVLFLMRTPYCTLDRRKFDLRKTNKHTHTHTQKKKKPEQKRNKVIPDTKM